MIVIVARIHTNYEHYKQRQHTELPTAWILLLLLFYQRHTKCYIHFHTFLVCVKAM